MRSPFAVAALLPSTRAVANAVADRSCVHEASFIVELGPGTGETTRAILNQMKRTDAKLLAIEREPRFHAALDQIEDKRLIAVQGSATELESYLREFQLPEPDVVVSGIPFSTIERATSAAIVRSIHTVLPPGGDFIAYQVRRTICGLTMPWFGPPISDQKVWFNLPPLTVFHWPK